MVINIRNKYLLEPACFKLSGFFLHVQDHIYPWCPSLFCILTQLSLMWFLKCSHVLSYLEASEQDFLSPRFHLVNTSPSLRYQTVFLFLIGTFWSMNLFRFSRNILSIFIVLPLLYPNHYSRNFISDNLVNIIGTLWNLYQIFLL